MKLTSHHGAGSTRKELEEALADLHLSEEDAFVLVERDSGEFLQMRRLDLERGKDGRLYRARVPAPIAAAFAAFAEGRSDWDRGLEWEDLEEAERRAGQGTPAGRAATWVVVGILGAVVGFAVARILAAVT